MLDRRKKVEQIVQYALESGSYCKVSMIQSYKNVCMYGVGKFFEEAMEGYKLKELLHVNLLCDRDKEKWGKEYNGITCISPDELRKIEDVIVIVMVYHNSEVIEKEFVEAGIPVVSGNGLCIEVSMGRRYEKTWFEKNKILETYDYLEDEFSRRVYTTMLAYRLAPQLMDEKIADIYTLGEYFNQNLFEISETEYLVDCGAFTGDSVSQLLEKTNNKIGAIYSFEIDNENFEILSNYIQSLPNEVNSKIECIHAGVWSEKTSVGYGKEEAAKKDSYSIVKENAKNIVYVEKIDDILAEKTVTYIKMDIEGSELEALKGAEQTIKKYRPKMGICIYHKLEDFWEISTFLKKLVPEYKIGIRHQSPEIYDTVLYAWCD